MTRVSAILPKLSGKKGILHLENVNDKSKTITFEQDLGEDGVIEDVDTAAAWSLVDNFEWMAGYGPTFGLVEVDRKNQMRYPKPSLKFLGSMRKVKNR